MTDTMPLPPSIVDSLTFQDTLILEFWLTKPDFIITTDEVSKYLGHSSQYPNHVKAFSRLRKKLGPLSKEKSHGRYQLAAVGKMSAPEQYYAQIVFGEECSPFDTLDRFLNEERIKKLIEVYLRPENLRLLRTMVTDFLDPHMILDAKTVANFEAYENSLEAMSQAYKVFAFHFKAIAQEAKKSRRDYQLFGDRTKLQTLLTLLDEKEGA